MMRRNVVACLLLLPGLCHAAAIKSNGTGGGKWSEGGTWAGGVVPGGGDGVTIVAGDVVVFDVDMSGWVDGIAGLVCDGTMNGHTAAGAYCLKTSADIGGTGRINWGSPETAYPSDCTMTFDFASKPSSFECASGLTVRLYCTQPTHPVVALAETAAAGQTHLPIDTDVRADTWAPGRTIRIDAVSGRVPDSEERTIGPDGVASGTITVDVGLTNARAGGAKVVLVARNIRIIGSTGYAVRNMTDGVLGCEISRCAHGISWMSGGTMSGVISGCSNGINVAVGCAISGTISGCAYGVISPSGCMISGTISGCSFGINQGAGCVISGTVSGCSTGVYAGSNTIQGAVFGGNKEDLRRVASVWAYDTLFGSATENCEYDTDRVPPWVYVASYGHDATADAFKAWTRGGVVVSDVNIAPPGYAISYRHICTSSALSCFRQDVITVGPGQTLRAWGKILLLDNHDAWPPRLELVDVRDDPLIEASCTALASAVVPAPRGRFY
jgi:hypothetical protein